MVPQTVRNDWKLFFANRTLTDGSFFRFDRPRKDNQMRFYLWSAENRYAEYELLFPIIIRRDFTLYALHSKQIFQTQKRTMWMRRTEKARNGCKIKNIEFICNRNDSDIERRTKSFRFISPYCANGAWAETAYCQPELRLRVGDEPLASIACS